MKIFSLKRCCICQCELFDRYPLCGDCFEKLKKLQWPERSLQEDVVIFSLFRYADEVRTLIRQFKFQEQRYVAEVLAQFVLRFLVQNKLSVDGVSYVPMHWYKRWVRGFDQAQDLAQAIAQGLGVPMYTLLARNRPTISLYKLDRVQRRRVMQASMRVHEPAPEEGYIMIVDDIMTTGATILACHQALQAANITNYFFLVIAKAIQNG